MNKKKQKSIIKVCLLVPNCCTLVVTLTVLFYLSYFIKIRISEADIYLSDKWIMNVATSTLESTKILLSKKKKVLRFFVVDIHV